MPPRSGRRSVLLLLPVVSLLLGVVGRPAVAAEGDPTFTAAPGGTVREMLTARVAFVDDDDDPDLVTGLVGTGFAVELGRGDGTFRTPVVVPVPDAAWNVAVGDVDGDSHADVVVPTSTGSVHVFLSNRDGVGSFRTGPVSPASRSLGGPLLLDADADGRLDLAVVTSGAVAFSLGDGTGRFQAPVSVPAAGVANVYAPAAGSFNGDAFPDLVLPRNGRPVAVLLSTGTPLGYRLVTTGATSALGVAVGQVHGDAVPEIAYAHGSTVGTLSYDAGTQDFRDRVLDRSLVDALGASIADLDRNGVPDVGTTSGGQQLLLLGDGSGGHRLVPGPPVDATSYSQTTTDVTSDGWPDVVLTSYGKKRNLVLTNLLSPPLERAPVLATHPSSARVVDGGSSTLTASATSDRPATATWQRLDGASWTDVAPSSTTAQGTTTTTTLRAEGRADQPGTYRAVFATAGNRVRTSSSDPAVVTAYQPTPPSFVTPFEDVVVREGSDRLVTVNAGGDPAPTVTWDLEPPNAPATALSETGPSATLRAVPLSLDGALLRVTLRNSAGTASAVARVVVEPLPRLLTEPADVAVRPGATVTFSTTHSGGGTARWQTSRDAGATWTAVPATGDVLTLPPVVAGQTGSQYRAVVTAAGTSPTPQLVTRGALLTVDPAPPAPLGLTATSPRPGTVVVAWQPPRDTPDVVGYAVTFRGTTTQHSATTRTVTLTGVPEGTHAVVVQAVDAQGPGNGATAEVTTAAGPASPPSAAPSPSPSRSLTPSPAPSPRTTALPTSRPTTTPAPTATPRPTATPTPSRPPTPAPTATAGTASPAPSGTRLPSVRPSTTLRPTASAAPSLTAPRGASPRPVPTPAGAPRPDQRPEPGAVAGTGPEGSGGSGDETAVDGVRPALRVAEPLVYGGRRSTIAGATTPGTLVQLYGYVRPATSYRLLRSDVADADGAFSFTTTPSGSMRAFVRTADGVDSDTVVQRVRPWIGLTATRQSARQHAFTGSVTPRRPGQLVTLYVVDGARRRLLANTRVDAKGVYRHEHAFTRPGNHRVVAVARRDLVTEPGESPVRALRR